MIPQLLTVFAPMLLGAQLLLTLILIKGDICPGQRGRIHKVLPSLAIMWLAVASVRIEAMMVVFAIGYFYTQVQTKKTREKGPIWVMYLANGLALAYVAIEVGSQTSMAASLSVLVQVVLLGGLLAHLLLTIARTRLQAFHRILPVSGVIAAMLMSLAVLLKVQGMGNDVLAAVTQPLLVGFVLMLSAVVVWSWHMLASREINKGQLGFALACMLLATASNQALFAL